MGTDFYRRSSVLMASRRRRRRLPPASRLGPICRAHRKGTSYAMKTEAIGTNSKAGRRTESKSTREMERRLTCIKSDAPSTIRPAVNIFYN